MGQYGTDQLTTSLGKNTSIDITAGSRTVTGNGTAWLANVSQGNLVYVDGDSVPWVVASVESNTSLTLAAPYYQTVDDASYAIHRDFISGDVPAISGSDRFAPDIVTEALRVLAARSQFGLRYIDLGVGADIPVLDRNLTAPPGGESEGDAYIPAATATGAWAGQEGNVAYYNGSGWDFTTPSDKEYVQVVDESAVIVWLDGAWRDWGITANLGGVAADALLALNAATNTHGLRYSTSNAGIELLIGSTVIATLTSAGLKLADDKWIGLGPSAARIEFDDQATDEVNILAARLGIGTSTPAQLVDIANVLLMLQVSTYGVIRAQSGQGISLQSDEGTGRIYFANGGNIILVPEGGTVYANGNLGVGVAAPVSKCDISGGLTIGATLAGVTAAPSNGVVVEGEAKVNTDRHVNGWKVRTLTLTGSQSLAIGDGNYLLFAGTGNIDITGITGMVAGDELIIQNNASSYTVTASFASLIRDDGGGTGAVINFEESSRYVYTGSGWVQVGFVDLETP